MSGLNKYQEYIVEAAFKNAVKGKPNTNTMLAWYEESGDFKQKVELASIWLDADLIPEKAPPLENGNCYTVKLNGSSIDVLQYHEKIPLYKVTGTHTSYSNILLADAIESSYGQGYAIRLFDRHGDELPFGLNKWVVDCMSGIMTFIDGDPEGFSAPYYISFFKYVGRKGTEGIVTTDGTKTMLPGYTPKEPKSLVTKDYVDSNVTDVSSIVKKLIPNTPGTFEGKDLEILNNHRRGWLVTTTDPSIEVVYLEDTSVKLRVPTFWDNNCIGFFAIYVNDNEFYKVPIDNLEKEDFESKYVNVESIVESYPDELVADDFYKSVNLTLDLDYLSVISPYMSNPDYPVVRIKVRWYSTSDRVGFYSNEIVIGLDNCSDIGRIYDTSLGKTKLQHKYISGVPAIVAGDSFHLLTTVSTLKKFRKEIHGHATIDGFLDEDIYTETYYSTTSPLMYVDKEIIVQPGIYQEQMTAEINCCNLDNITNGQESYLWNIRTDSVSDESKRVSSPDENKLNYGLDWDDVHQKTNLKDSNELQMLNGKYQWPRGNYLHNGESLGFNDVWGSGPNYDNIEKTGIRYVTFKYELKNANGFYFEIDDAEGFASNPETRAFTNIDSLNCILPGKYEWLDMNVPFDGVLSPFDFEDKGCLVVNRSNSIRRYCTFGTEVLSGTMYIVLGIPYNLNIKLSGISVFLNE